MQSTRGRIVELLRGGGATVESITSALGLAPATVRRHLDVLLRDGMVEMRSERMPLGRPHFVFTLSEGGLEGLPSRQFRFVAATLETILALTPRDTRHRSGSQLAALVFERLTERLLSECRPAVTARELDRRMEQATAALNAAGLELRASLVDDRCVVLGLGCPCSRLLTAMGDCPHEAHLLSELTGVPLRRVESGPGSGARTFLVATSPKGVL